MERVRANGYKLPAELDRRITRLGRFLRRSSLDELPQVLNVLRGTMSLVGPRPVVPAEVDNYGDARDVYLSVRPGITGAWQVNGRSTIDYPERVDIDAEYVARLEPVASTSDPGPHPDRGAQRPRGVLARTGRARRLRV